MAFLLAAAVVAILILANELHRQWSAAMHWRLGGNAADVCAAQQRMIYREMLEYYDREGTIAGFEITGPMGECAHECPDLNLDAWGKPDEVLLLSSSREHYFRFEAVTYGDGRTFLVDETVRASGWDQPLMKQNR
jgi:hypothetical protein